MDYKDLLKKYIKHVGDNEGTEFLSNSYSTDNLTEEELKELQDISDTTYPIVYTKGTLTGSKERSESLKKVLLEDLQSIGSIKTIVVDV